MEDMDFLNVWHNAMTIGAIIMGSAGIIVYLIYKLRVSLISDNKAKFDFINANEIKWFKIVFFFFGLSVGLLINLYGRGGADEIGLWFFVRIFIGIAGATLVTYVASLILEYYYPTRINYKLRKLRYTPRINPKTGNRMRLLSEDEEDVHLNEGMQAEENIFSIDYDVWLDEASGDVQIEKYFGHLVALQCNNCGFYTMRVFKEEIVVKNEDGSPKELLKHYQCSYCKNLRATQFIVSKKEAPDYKSQKPANKRSAKNIELVRLDLHSNLGAKRSFEFSSVDEAKKFLDEFDFDKVV